MKRLRPIAQFFLSTFYVGIFGIVILSGTRLKQLDIVNFHISQIFAINEVDVLQKQIDDIKHLRQLSEDATKPLEAEVGSLEKRVNNARYSIQVAKNEAEALAARIEEREVDLALQYQIFARRIAQQYKRIRAFSPITMVLASDNAADLTKDLAYRDSIKNQDNQFIKAIGEDIRELQADKKQLESDQITLAALEEQLDEQASFFKIEIGKAKDYQQDLSGQIASLTAKQKAIISARSGSYTTSAGDVPIGSDYDASIAGFRDNAPGGSFAVFSFGAYTHRKGMSQYGAKSRAEDGQDYKKILKEYYGKEPVQKDTSGNISVQGYPDLNFEEYYLYGIAEMPSSWHKEALKAQAVAARTYAYRYKSEGKTICITEACQVFNNSKAASVPDSWKQAVQETKGMVLEDVVTYYSSTSGGYLETSGWDTTDKSGNGEWTSRAWEVKANSPWFYKAWYRQGYTNSSNSCGRKPWISEEEMADILNAYLLRQNSGGADMNRLLPVTIGSCSIGGQSGSPYSMSELRGLVGNAVTSISGNPIITHSGDGETNLVRFSTNRGDISMTGAEFKEIFNTRAPGYISIPQSRFAFFNIERK